jgi:hypothetical protein
VNIGNSLPDAPANAVVVDPNDANTVYLAMDTGVYVTTAVATCATTSCWSVFGSGLPNAPVVALVAAPAMAAGNGSYGELRAGTYGRGIWEIPLLTAAPPAAPAMTLAPASLTFAAQAIATASPAQTITVTNSGTAALTISQIAATGDFNETDNCIGAPIAIGAACVVQVRFLPSATGTRTGVLTVYGNVAGGQATATLTGMGVAAAAIILSPIAVTYSGTNVGSASATQNITVSNTGGVTANLQAPVVTGDFTITANTCGPTLAPNVGCTVAIAFQPTASGTRTGSFSIADSAGTQTASLGGQGVLPATDTLAPLMLSFPAQVLNTASATQQVTLTNAGDTTLTLIAAQIASGDFTVVNGCGSSLIGHSTCSLLVAYVPRSVGAETGVLTVTDQLRSQTVTLNGVGVAPAGVSLSPVGTVAFAPTGVGLAAATQTVTLTNNGGLPLQIQSIAAMGDFVIVSGTNTCGANLATGAACTLGVTFSPTAAGARTGRLSVVDNTASSPQSLQLTGTGVDFALSANGATTATIPQGGQAMYPLLLSSAGGLPGTVAFTCAPAPAHATCLVNPSMAALGGTTLVTVTVATSVAELRMPNGGPAFWLAGLLQLGLLGLARGRRLRLGATAVLGCFAIIMMAGCGASRVIPATNFSSGTSVAPTPDGTYNLVVSGTSAGLTRSVGLTVVVQ